MNDFYIDKIDKLRAGIPRDDAHEPPKGPKTGHRFSFSFANAGKIARIIRKLSNTTALGVDDIPTSVFKKGVETLAGPISHLVNRSLADAMVPTGFKHARVIPVYKGKGKAASDPSSYRPVSILPAMSKILELVVKEDLDKYLDRVQGLPSTQFGFRTGRSTTSAISMAHGKWCEAKAKGHILGVLAFDFSAAFDTVDSEMLIAKLNGVGVIGKEADWFRSYMRGGKQVVVWRDTTSSPNDVKYGVRQGSILGPLLFLILMADLPTSIGAGEQTLGYADDVTVWASSKSLKTVKTTLESRAAAFVSYAARNALVLNPSKTQLLLVGSVRKEDRATFSIKVGGSEIQPATNLDLLGVRIGGDLSLSGHLEDVARATRVRSGMVARLAKHVPRGPYLRQLALGILLGKMGYAAPAVAPLRLDESEPRNGYVDKIQVALNEAARAITGKRQIDHVTVPSLLQDAGLPSYNRLAVRAVAIETWKAWKDWSNAGNNTSGQNEVLSSTSNPLSNFLFGCECERKQTRAASEGHMLPPLPCASATMVWNAYKVWNKSERLRLAPNLASAKRAAKELANSCPL